MINKEIQNIIDSHKYLEEILKLNDYMADNPEISGEEYESSAKIVELLRSKGIEVKYPYAELETAFKASIFGLNPEGPKICIMAEYDALPGIGHGCGHSASGSISVLAALIINDLKSYFSGQVDIVGTPDEEVLGGKIKMAAAGVFDDYDYAIMMHMNNYSSPNSKFLVLDGINIEFTGKTSHASASPWDGRNALNAMQLFFHSIDMMRQHVKPDIRLHGYIKEGGKAPNIVPDYSLSEFYIRGNELSYVEEIRAWVEDCVKAAALATRTTGKVSKLCDVLKDIAPNKYAEDALTEKFKHYGVEVFPVGEPMGSSDIGDVDYVCPAFHPLMGVKEGISLHTKEFADEMTTENGHNAIEKGGKIIASFVMETLLDNELLNNIKAEYKKQRNK